MYSELYPHLKEKYNFDNFEVVMDVLDKQFGDLFNLSILNEECKKKHWSGSYISFFDAVMKALTGLYTPDEVLKVVGKCLLDKQSDAYRMMTLHEIFVPDAHRMVPQIGYIEKLMSGELSAAEPLTYVDMVRVARWMSSRSNYDYDSALANYSVVHVNWLHTQQRLTTVLFVNFSKDPKGRPKWGVVDLRNLAQPKVYCEALLLEGEKRALEEGLGRSFTPDVYLGGTAAFSVSTGLTALAWANEHVKRTCALTLDSDFYALTEEFMYTQASGRTLYAESEDSFYSASFKHYKGDLYTLARAVILGELGVYHFPANDFCTALDVLAEHGISSVATHAQIDVNARSFVLGLDAALRDLGILKEGSDIVTLNVPNEPDYSQVSSAYGKHAASYAVPSSWLNNIKRTKASYHDTREDLATGMVLSVFRGRAKKQKLAIDLPKAFQLNQQEETLILKFMEANPFVTELIINDNHSLQCIKRRLEPTFARNRWLAANGYRPPMADNYWKQAAKYWLIHLHERTDILADNEEHQLFKRCVREMGVQGLNAVLGFLNDETERGLIERVYGSHEPSFYLACPLVQTREYVTTLLRHLKQPEAYFPFSEVGFGYQAGNDALLVELLGELNKLERFDQIVVTDLLRDKVACAAFLKVLAQQCHAQKWTGLIVIPELVDTRNATDELRDLQIMYAQVNNVILRNRHEQAALKMLQGIQAVSDFNVDEGASLELDKIDVGGYKEVADKEEVDFELLFSGIDPNSSWPLKRGGAVQLQLQQQQQIEQSRQIQQEQQRVHIHAVEESLQGELVNYTNIEKLLGAFFRAFSQEHDIHETAALLAQSPETVLQGFFHTWINANPTVKARYIIRDMTLDAAKALIRHHRLLPSGLNPDNLPKGFYTQRSKDDNLILCYNAELAYINAPTPLTLNLDIRESECTAWEGDFRQFNLTKFLNSSPLLDSNDWLDIVLFAKMQPAVDHRNDVEEFCNKHREGIAKRFGLNSSIFFSSYAQRRKKMEDNWHVFMQVWQYAGADGVEAFFNTSDSEFALDIRMLRQRLVRNQSRALQDWLATVDMDEQSLRALGQVFYRYGDQGLTLFLTKLMQMEKGLGNEFFTVFNKTILKSSRNYNAFMHEGFFTSMDSMITSLRPSVAKGNLLVWQAVLAKHVAAVGWDNVDALWRGFAYFLGELEQLGLILEGSEFEQVKPENMFVCMDRILATLKHIPDAELQQQFMQRLGSMDRTHGGVHYAIQYERFKYFDSSLKLHDFNEGNPTYAPNLTELFSWLGQDAEIKMRRTLASQSRFSHVAYPILSAKLANDELSSKNVLMWLLHTQYPMDDISAIMGKIDVVHADVQSVIAKHLHYAVYQLKNHNVLIQLDALIDFVTVCNSSSISLSALLTKYPYGTALESMSILHQAGRWNATSINALNTLLQSSYTAEADYPGFLSRDVFKLAALFGVQHTSRIQEFYNQTKQSLPIVRNELRLLITQILSVDYKNSKIAESDSSVLWLGLLSTINKMNDKPGSSSAFRIDFMDELSKQGWTFKYSKSGAFRALTTKEADGPEGLNFFTDHEDRLWRFLQAHIVVPAEGDANEALQPIIRFLKRLQLNRTYLNEIEPLLASLEKTSSGHYWSASYFYGLLRALQPEDAQAAFPISLLKVILNEPGIAAKLIDHVDTEFPNDLVAPLQTILKNTAFNRKQQTLLAQIALREFNWQGNVGLLSQIMATLSLEQYKESRAYALAILAHCKNFPALERSYNNCVWLLQRGSTQAEVAQHWTKTSAIWLKAISNDPRGEQLFLDIQKLAVDEEQKTLILHVIAWSSIYSGLKSAEEHEYELDRRAPKLVQYLAKMSEADLRLLAQCYPQQPSPTADDILFLLKKHEKGIAWEQCINEFLTHPFPEPRADYGVVAHTREADLRRMLKATQISRGSEREGISPKSAAQITLIFSYLKNLENGSVLVSGTTKAISHMSQKELSEAFRRLSQESEKYPNDDFIRAQIWALLFQALGQTTRKYPHLAQQFALIANDVCIDSSSRVLQLATGEGKSHFVAMRAARHAACGKVVDVCTAKRTLAERDLEDYQNLFAYLGFKAAYIHPKSAPEDYIGTQIHYTTAGDLSLFLDEQSYLGNPIPIEKDKRVGLFDEFDFVRFEEGRKTEYNYARPTGKTPKQMTWFYQVINEFYNTHKQSIITNAQNINKQVLLDLAAALQLASEDNDERKAQVKQILRDPLQLVQWIQSAHEAHELEWGVGFTVHEEHIEVGDESYPMREIIPLSSDNQKMFGSTFSAGVQQLLAVRLNTEARLKGQPQNFHIHPESHIISSQVAAQRMKELWGSWEGFSGTISAAQAMGLYSAHKTAVLHVPTNQRDLRFWHKPNFYQTGDERLEVLVQQIRQCFAQQKSILFSCKNDKQVLELESQLKTKLTAEELAQFDFYTNEQNRTASEVLEGKRQNEAWCGGKKQKGIGLVASGFGRGDNVGVEAVFLFNVNDTNDLLQKGGRTARNGEEGEVFQFYLTNELVAEEAVLKQMLEAAKIDMVALEAKLAEVLGNNAEELCFERVMLLREYVFSLDNQPNQGYHNALAQLSAWGMKLLGEVSDPNQRNILMISFSLQLKHLEKRWIDISSKTDTTTAVKIKAIETEVEASATKFVEHYNIELGVVKATELKLAKQGDERIELVITKTPKPTAVERAAASICTTMMQCLNGAADSRIGQIPLMLDALSKNPKRLLSFAKESASLASMEQFINQLELALEQIKTPSKAWQDVSVVGDVLVECKDLLLGVVVREPFERAMHGLTPAMQTLVIDTLRTPNFLSVDERIQAMIPVLVHIGTFSRSQQASWGAEYISELDSLLNENPRATLVSSLENSYPMSFGHFNGLMHLAQHYSTDESSLKQTFKFLGKVIKDSPEQRIRMLTKWSALVATMQPDAARHFLFSFAHTMESFTEGKDWDSFTNLVRKTESGWNKGEGQNQQRIIEVWNLLAMHKEHLPQLNSTLSWGLGLVGTTWFQVLRIMFSLDSNQLAQHQVKMQKAWKQIDSTKASKKEKLEQFSHYVNVLLDLHGIFATDKANTWLDKIAGFADERKAKAMFLIAQHKKLFTAQPQACEWLLTQLANKATSLEQVDLLLNSLVLVADYQANHPDISMDYLLSGLNRFYKQGTRVLSQLHNYLQTQPEHTTKVLFDKTMEHFNSIPESMIPLTESVISACYKAIDSAKRRPAEIIDSADINALFEFNSSDKQSRNKRLAFMQLLYKNVFVSEGVNVATPKLAYKWDDVRNEALFELGLSRYVEHTQAILDTQKPQFNLHQVHDLSVSQQVGLLNVADEMKQIGTLQLISSQWDIDEPVQALSRDLGFLLNTYKSSRFKSTSRERQVAEFESDIETAFGASKRESRYEMVLNVLHSAKMAAISSDIQEDRSRWFKMNRGGESRYYNALNQMEDLVMRYWVKDKQAIRRVQTIEQFKQKEFKALVTLFDERMAVEYPKEWEPNGNKIGQRLSRFFTSSDKQKSINELRTAVHAYASDASLLNRTQLNSLMRVLQTNSSVLPGHMSTLCNELLTRGAALNEFYTQKAQDKDKGKALGL